MVITRKIKNTILWINLLLLRNLFSKVLFSIDKHSKIYKYMTQCRERRTLIVSDILHGVLVLVHPNLHLPCWELFDEHVRNRNDYCAIFLCGQKYFLEDSIIVPSWNVIIKQLIHFDVMYFWLLVLFRKSRSLHNFAIQFPAKLIIMRNFYTYTNKMNTSYQT